MNFTKPSKTDIEEIVADFNMSLSAQEIDAFHKVMQETIDQYSKIDQMEDNIPEVKYPERSYQQVDEKDNQYNAWYLKTEIKGSETGALQGKTVAIKDNVCVANIPMMNGSSTLEGYVPDLDATIITRLLDAGASIVGKSHCECFCLSGGSHTNSTGFVHNPHKHGYSAGGSSSGSGALVGGKEVDIAIGGDQGGSIRIPASYSGCYGMKPTHGLVPYSGIMPIETTIDHTGPMTQNVLDNAKTLEAISGIDGLDPRQYRVNTELYSEFVDIGCSGLKIGVLKEGFGKSNSEKDVDKKVQEASKIFSKMGAQVSEVSIPWHNKGPSIWTPIALDGLTNQMMSGNGMGTGWKGLYTNSLLDFHSQWINRADQLSDTLKISMFIGQYYLKNHAGFYYAKAQNLARKLTKEYDDALKNFDLLLMPTLPLKATPLPAEGAPLQECCDRAFEMLSNTCPFDVSGHPAMSIPCGFSEGLPVGMMLVANHFAESKIYQAAGAFENFKDWEKL